MNKNVLIGIGVIILAYVIYTKSKKTTDIKAAVEETANACGSCGGGM